MNRPKTAFIRDELCALGGRCDAGHRHWHAQVVVREGPTKLAEYRAGCDAVLRPVKGQGAGVSSLGRLVGRSGSASSVTLDGSCRPGQVQYGTTPTDETNPEGQIVSG